MARATTRIYTVVDTGAPAAPTRLVRATHPNRARDHVAGSRFAVEVASQDALVTLLRAGADVEDATETEGERAPASMAPAAVAPVIEPPCGGRTGRELEQDSDRQPAARVVVLD